MGLLKKPKKTALPVAGRWKTVGYGGSSLRPRQAEKPPPCRTNCPIGNDARGAMALLARREAYGLSEADALDQAFCLLTTTNPFPAVLGRVCPHPCERHCNRSEKDDAVAVAAVERFIGDWGIDRGLDLALPDDALSTGKSVAIVGAGPGGLSCAYQLLRRGHAVTVFEANPLAGGMLRYGVPAYRLSRSVLDAEIGRLLRLGLTLECGARVGADVSLEQLRDTHDAVFVAIGAHRSRRLEVSGELGGDVLSGIEFLRLAHSAAPLSMGDRVAVVGDGQTAVDVARVANRLGMAAGNGGCSVTLVRAHGRDEQDLAELAVEGIRVVYEATPIAVERDDGGRVMTVKTQRACLGPPGPDGLRLPVGLGEPAEDVPATSLIAAVSQVPDWKGLGLFDGARGVEVDEWGRTPLGDVWSGGDSVALGFVAESVGQGLRSARSIDAELRGVPLGRRSERQPVSTGRVKLGLYPAKVRSSRHRLTPQEGLDNLSAELDQGITQQQVFYEAGRCLGCGACTGCERCWMFCTPGCFSRRTKVEPGEPDFALSLPMCDGCGKCADECPSGFLEMV